LYQKRNHPNIKFFIIILLIYFFFSGNDDSKSNQQQHQQAKPSSSSPDNTLSVILQRCQSSIDGVLAQQIDAAMLQEIEDDEELMRDAAIPDETDENIDDEFMEEEDFAQTEKALLSGVNEISAGALAFESGLQRIRELKRRNVSNNNNSRNSSSRFDSRHAEGLTDKHSHQQQLQQDQLETPGPQPMSSTDLENMHFASHHHHHDEFVLKCQFSALIPAFDPRPGKNNINQIQDISVPFPPLADSNLPNPTTAASQLSSSTVVTLPLSAKIESSIQDVDSSRLEKPTPKIELYLKVDYPASGSTILADNGLEFINDEIKLTNRNATIFQYIQNLISIQSNTKNSKNNTLHFEKMKNIWDMNYTLTYREASSPIISSTDQIETKSTPLAYDEPDLGSSILIQTQAEEVVYCSVDQVLQLLKILKSIISDKKKNETIFQDHLVDYKKEFISEKINNKLIQQLQDPLVLASRSLPDWCKNLLYSYKYLFPFETRQLYFNTTAFGVSRSIVWLQNKRDTLLNNLRGPASQRIMRDDHEFRIGRLKHERIKIPRDPPASLLRAAINSLKFHATRKAILEIEFIDEEGTGLGPTLEFFSLIAAELQRKKLAIWYSDDKVQENELDGEQIANLSDSYVHQLNGLFPIPYPAPKAFGSLISEEYIQHYKNVIEIFHFMGIFLAKSLQDQRLVDLPFSFPFLKILCSYHENQQQGFLDENSNSNVFDLENLLSLNDLTLIDPHRSELLIQLNTQIESRKLKDKKDIEDFEINLNGNQVKLDDLGLVFEYNPPSSVYGFNSYKLKPNGENIVIFHFNFE